MRMVTLQQPKTGARVCIQRTADAIDLDALGYPGWTIVAELDAMPVEELTPEQQEEARLNSLSRAEFMAEVSAKATAEVQLAAESMAVPKPNA
jgi:hypothetical protein